GPRCAFCGLRVRMDLTQANHARQQHETTRPRKHVLPPKRWSGGGLREVIGLVPQRAAHEVRALFLGHSPRRAGIFGRTRGLVSYRIASIAASILGWDSAARATGRWWVATKDGAGRFGIRPGSA